MTQGACMSGSFYDDWNDGNYFQNLSATEHDAICKMVFVERLNGNLDDIPEGLQHPAWAAVKDSITESLALWQIALLHFPFKDKIDSDHPLAFNFKNRRRYLIFDLLDAVYAGGLKLHSLPRQDIENPLYFESSPLDAQLKAKIHVNDLEDAITGLKVNMAYSVLVKQWRMLAAKRRQPALEFMSAPETQRVIGCFSYPFSWLTPDENGELRDSIEGIPLSMAYPSAPEIRKMDTREEWYHHRLSPENYDEKILKSRWMQRRLVEMQRNVHKGILSYPLLERPPYMPSLAPPQPPFNTVEERRAAIVEAFQAYAITEGFDYQGNIPREHKAKFIKLFIERHPSEDGYKAVSVPTIQKDWQALLDDNRLGRGFTTRPKKS